MKYRTMPATAIQFDTIPKIFETNREDADIPDEPFSGVGTKEIYQTFQIESYFRCVCGMSDDPCGYKFYITANGKLYTDYYVYDDQRDAINDAKEIIEIYWELLADYDTERYPFIVQESLPHTTQEEKLLTEMWQNYAIYCEVLSKCGKGYTL